MTASPHSVWKFLVGAAIAAGIGFLVWYFMSVVVYVLVSAILAVLGRPLVKYLASRRIRRWRVPRSLAAAVTLVVIWVVAATFFALFIPPVLNKLDQLGGVDLAAAVNSLGEPINRLQQDLQSIFALPENHFSISAELVNALRSIVDFESVQALCTSAIGFVTSAVIALFSISFITFFFLKEEDLFTRMVKAVMPERFHENITRAFNSVSYLLMRYFSGVFTESLLVMIAVWFTMMAFGMPAADAVFIGLVMGVMNVVPYAGPLIGAILSAFVGMVNPISGTTPLHTATIVICSVLVIKALDDFILQPTLYSERVKAHPLEVFLVILIAGSMAGIVGMLLAIPAYTVLRVFAKEFFSQFSLVRKLTERI